MKNKLLAGVLTAVTALVPAAGVFAQGLTIQDDSAIQATGSVGGAKIEVRTTAEVKAEQGTSSRGQSDEHPTTTVKTESGVGSVVSVEAKEVRGWDTEEKEAFMLTLKSALQVQTEQELENFAQGVLLKNENVESVDLEDESVEVRYKQKARFLGMFPGDINAHVVASEQGKVNVKFPWYRFLYRVPETSQDTELETSLGAEISTAIKPILQARVQGSANADLTLTQRLQLKAKILETISAFLSARASTE